MRIWLRFHFNSAWLSTGFPNTLAGNLMSRAAGKAGRLLNHWSFFYANQDPKISNGSFSKVARVFFAQSAFPGGLSGDIFFTNDQNKYFLLYLSLALLSFGVLFHGKIQNWRALFQTGMAWNFKILLKMEDFPSLKDSIYRRLPFLQSERGQIILWLWALSVFNLDVKLGLAWN